MYHGVIDDSENTECWWLLKKSEFEKQIKYISRNYNVISIDDAINILLDSNLRFNNNAVITFDDGYRNILSNACPILNKYNLPSTIYITTGPVETDSLIWIDQIYSAIYHCTDQYINLEDIGLGSSRDRTSFERSEFAKDVTDKFKKLSLKDKEKKLTILNKRLPYIPGVKNPFKLLSINDIKELSRNPLVTIGAHTINHEILTNISFDSAVNEISDSKKRLEEWLGRPVDHFAYPNGNYNNEIKTQLEKIGFKSAVTTNDSILKSPNFFELPRLGIGAWDDMATFKCLTSGIIPILKTAKSFIRN